MKYKLKLKSAWNEFEAGSVIEVDEATKDALKLAGIAEDWDAEKEAQKQSNTEALKKTIKEEVTTAVKEAVQGMDSNAVKVKFEVVEDESEKNVKKGILHIAEMMKALASNDQDALRKHTVAMKAALGNQEAVDADGGYLVDYEFLSQIVDHMMGELVFTRNATVIPVSGPNNGIKFPEVLDYTRTNGNHAANVYWIAEAAAKTASTPQFNRISIELEKAVGLYYSTDELLMDRSALATIIEDWFSREFSYQQDYCCLRGSGTAQPLGVLAAGNAALVSVARAGAGAIAAADVFNMFARMYPQGLGRAEWFVSNTAYAGLQSLTVGNQPVFLPPQGNNGVINAPAGTLLGRPINILEQASTLGTEGDLLFCCMEDYWIIERGGIEGASSIHVQFTTDQTAYRWVRRWNGRPKWSNVITPNVGSATLSPFVTLTDPAS